MPDTLDAFQEAATAGEPFDPTYGLVAEDLHEAACNAERLARRAAEVDPLSRDELGYALTAAARAAGERRGIARALGRFADVDADRLEEAAIARAIEVVAHG